MELCQRMAEWINTNFISRREERSRVEPLIERELWRTANVHAEIVFALLGIAERICQLVIQGRLSGSGKCWQMQLPICRVSGNLSKASCASVLASSSP